MEPPSVFATTVEHEIPRPHNFVMLPKDDELLRSLVSGKHYHLAFHRQSGMPKAKQMTCNVCPEDIYVKPIVRAITAKNKSTRQCTCTPYIWRCEPCFWWHVTTPEKQREYLEVEKEYITKLAKEAVRELAAKNTHTQ
jgi:hypothetical protein